MNRDTVRTRLRGVAAGLLTPFESDGAIDHDALAANAGELYDRGLRTFLACANISEYHSLTGEERRAVTETSVSALPDDACVLAGVGGPTGEAVEMCRDFADIGADAAMVMPPDHTYVHEQGLLEYYRELGRASDLPLTPYVRGFDPSVSFPEDIAHSECRHHTARGSVWGSIRHRRRVAPRGWSPVDVLHATHTTRGLQNGVGHHPATRQRNNIVMVETDSMYTGDGGKRTGRSLHAKRSAWGPSGGTDGRG